MLSSVSAKVSFHPQNHHDGSLFWKNNRKSPSGLQQGLEEIPTAGDLGDRGDLVSTEYQGSQTCSKGNLIIYCGGHLRVMFCNSSY